MSALAADLDAPDRRRALDDGLAALVAEVEGLAEISAAVATLRAEPDLAWRCYALALLAESLADAD